MLNEPTLTSRTLDFLAQNCNCKEPKINSKVKGLGQECPSYTTYLTSLLFARPRATCNGGASHGALRERIFEIVGVFSVGDDDVHFACEAYELTGAGIGDDGDTEFRDAAGHGAGVLQDEGAGTDSGGSTQSSGNAFDGNVTGGAFDVGHGGEHLAFAGSFEIAMELFVNGHAADGGVADFVILGLGRDFDIEWSSGVSSHGSSLLSWSGLRGGGARPGEAEDYQGARDNAGGGDARSRSHACIVVWSWMKRQPPVPLGPGIDGFSFLDEGDKPSHDALPAFGVSGGSGGIAGEAFLTDL